MGSGTTSTCAGGQKSESSGPWCFQSCSTDVRIGLWPGIWDGDLIPLVPGLFGESLAWLDYMSNERLLRETQMIFVTCIVRERQLRLYGHVAHFPDADPAHRILSANGPSMCLVVAAGWSASQGSGDRPGICLGDGQTEAPGVPAESGRSDALLWRMLPYRRGGLLTNRECQ